MSDHVTDNSQVSPVASVGMNVTFLNGFDEGQAYSEARYRDWLEEADFKSFVREPFMAGNSLISAENNYITDLNLIAGEWYK